LKHQGGVKERKKHGGVLTDAMLCDEKKGKYKKRKRKRKFFKKGSI